MSTCVLGARSGFQFRAWVGFVSRLFTCRVARDRFLAAGAEGRALQAKEKPAGGEGPGPHFEDLSFRNFCGWLFTTLTTTSIFTCIDRDGASSQAYPTLSLQATSCRCALGREYRKAKRRPDLLSGSRLGTGQQRKEATRKRADYGSFYRATRNRLVPQERSNNQTSYAPFVLTI